MPPNPPRPVDWLLSKSERANPRTRLDDPHPGDEAWSEGNLVRPLIHGTTYFAELFERIEATREGDLLFFTDWQGDADERLTGEPGTEVLEVLGRADERGVDVRGLIWRSHLGAFGFTAGENRRLGRELQRRGAEAILDMRVRIGGSHHQKLLVIRHRDDPTRDVAYVGGIDLCHSRSDDADHHGDPQAMQSLADEYGDRPPWHDIQAAISGPAVHDVETVFRERWEDPTRLSRSPIRLTHDDLRRLDVKPDPLPEQQPPPPPVEGGTHVVQLLRTYPNLRHGRDYRFARGGERSVARGYTKAVARARHLIYVEDQYLWGHHVGDVFTLALREHRDLRVIAVIPLHPDLQGLSRYPQLLGRQRAMRRCWTPRPTGSRSTASRTTPAHRSTCTPRPASSTTPGPRSAPTTSTAAPGPTTPSSSAVVIDTAGEYARRLRLTLAAEHLDRSVDDMDDCVDAAGMFTAFEDAAETLDRWHAAGCEGTRPPGRLRRIQPPELGRLARTLAAAPYSLLHDPDGRPKPLRRSDEF